MSEIILSKPELRSIDTTTEALSTTLSKVTGKPYYISNTGTAGNILTVLPTDGSTVELGDGDFQSFIYDGSGWLIGFSGGAIAGGGGAGVGLWDIDVVYDIDELCFYNDVWYQSLTDSNTGNQPDTSPTEWEVTGYLSNYSQTELTAISDKTDSNETRIDTNESVIIDHGNRIVGLEENGSWVTFTPIISFGEAVVSNLVGMYKDDGVMVHVHIEFIGNNYEDSVGIILITGLPQSLTDSDNYGVLTVGSSFSNITSSFIDEKGIYSPNLERIHAKAEMYYGDGYYVIDGFVRK